METKLIFWVEATYQPNFALSNSIVDNKAAPVKEQRAFWQDTGKLFVTIKEEQNGLFRLKGNETINGDYHTLHHAMAAATGRAEKIQQFHLSR